MDDKVVVEFFDKEKTILEQMFDKKIIHPYGCLGGSCGACEMNKPLSGDVIEIDIPIFPVHKNKILPCICKINKNSESVSLLINKNLIR